MGKKIRIRKILQQKNIDTLLINNTLKTLDGKDGKDGKKLIIDKINFDFPEKNEIFHLVTNRPFHLTEFIDIIIETEKIETLCCATYSIGNHAVNKFLQYLNAGKLLKGYFVFSTMAQNRKEKLENCYNRVEAIPEFEVCYLFAHAKVLTLKTEKNNFVITGSCNLAHNGQIENIEFYNSAELLNFHSGWIKKSVEYYKLKNTKNNGSN